jgi:Thiopurine S-methyltransferase (TPMT)
VQHEEWDRRYADSEFLWTVEPNRFVVQELGDVTPGYALDFACGEGRNAVWLAQQGWRVTAVDFSPVGLANAYQLVLVAYLHIEPVELATVLRKARTALTSRGEILVVGHDLSNLRDGIGGPQDPSLLYTPATIAAELPGLSIVRAERVRRPVEIDGQVHDAIDTLVRASRP